MSKPDNDPRKRLQEENLTGLIYLVKTGWILIISAIVVVATHYLTPTAWHFLEQGQLNAVQGFLFSSAFIGFVSTYIRRQIDS